MPLPSNLNKCTKSVGVGGLSLKHAYQKRVINLQSFPKGQFVFKKDPLFPREITRETFKYLPTGEQYLNQTPNKDTADGTLVEQIPPPDLIPPQIATAEHQIATEAAAATAAAQPQIATPSTGSSATGAATTGTTCFSSSTPTTIVICIN